MSSNGMWEAHHFLKELIDSCQKYKIVTTNNDGSLGIFHKEDNPNEYYLTLSLLIKYYIDFRKMELHKEIETLFYSKCLLCDSSGGCMAECEKPKSDSIEELFNIVLTHFDRDIEKTEKWFHTSNPLLGGQKPFDLIKTERFRKLLKFIISGKEGNFA